MIIFVDFTHFQCVQYWDLLLLDQKNVAGVVALVQLLACDDCTLHLAKYCYMQSVSKKNGSRQIMGDNSTRLRYHRSTSVERKCRSSVEMELPRST